MEEAEKQKMKEESYITKEELIEFIDKTNFKYVKSCNMDLITGFIPTEEDEYKALYKTINLY